MASRPYAEIGVEDDWSYIRSAEILARTGHLVYNGWASPILGWLLYWGALFVKLFGFSFTTLRSSMLILAMLTVFLFHRCLARCGLSRSNAVLGALMLGLSPLTISLSFTFMSDMAGMLSIVAALYACLRALQASTAARSILWLTVATGIGLAGGTVRQIAWLTALVMVPSTAYLLRGRARLAGYLLLAATLLFVLVSLQWWQHQPYSVAERLLPAHFSLSNVSACVVSFTRVALTMPLFLLPLFLPFVLLVPWRRSRHVLTALSLIVICLLVGLFQLHRHKLYVWLTPYTQNFVTSRGLIDVPAILGNRPVVLHTGFRVFLTFVTFAAAFSFVVYLWEKRHEARMPRAGDVQSLLPSWRSLSVVLVPFTLAYLMLVAPRAARGNMLDRYLLPVIAVAIVFATRVFQDYVPKVRVRRLSLLSLLTTSTLGLYAVAALHDVFALSRARLAAIQEPLAAGVPRSQIGGGFEYDNWTELEIAGHVNEPNIATPADAYKAPAVPLDMTPCHNEEADLAPHVVPQYILSFDPGACAGLSRFSPIVYRAWLIPEPITVYILKTPLAGSSPGA